MLWRLCLIIYTFIISISTKMTCCKMKKIWKSNTFRKPIYHSLQAVTTTPMKPRKCSSNKEIMSCWCIWIPISTILRNVQMKPPDWQKFKSLTTCSTGRLWRIKLLIHCWWESNRVSWQHRTKLWLCLLSAPEIPYLGMWPSTRRKWHMFKVIHCSIAWKSKD